MTEVENLGADVERQLGQNTKRILIFSSAYYPKYVGGAEVAIKEITDRIPNTDIEFHMITNRFDSSLPKIEQVGNVLVHRIGIALKNVDINKTHSLLFKLQKILFVPEAAVMCYQLRKKYQYHAFWAMMAYMTFPIVLLRLIRIRVPYVLTLQEGDPFEHVFKRWYIVLVSPLLSAGFMKAEIIQAISTYLARWAESVGYEGPVEVIPNAVDIEVFGKEVPVEAVGSARAEMGKSEGEVFLITTSRLVHKNALDDVIRALGKLPEHVHFCIIGEGPLQGTLRTIATAESVTHRVHFLGFKDRNRIPAFLHASDIFIRPSRSEGMGISFIEAMAAGVPVIATQEGGIADFLFDEKRNPDRDMTGWAVERDRPEQIATAVEDIMARPGHVEWVVKNAKRMIHEKYEWNLIASDMRNKIFSSILQG